MNELAYRVAHLFGMGFAPRAPGTVASLTGAVSGALILSAGGAGWLLLAIAAALPLGLWSVGGALRFLEDSPRANRRDPPEVVIDELAGQWIAMLPCAIPAERGTSALVWGALAAFVLFRFFDITKPGPIGKAESLGGASGVMLDDLLAGIASALLLLFLLVSL